MIRVNPPDSLPVIRAAAHVAGLACCDDDLIGTWVRLLAASKPGGTLLHLATGTGELAAWLAAGMDLSSRLVTLIEAEAVATAVTETIAQDLRVTVHRQDVDEFLDDVQGPPLRSHRARPGTAQGTHRSCLAAAQRGRIVGGTGAASRFQ